MLSGLAVVTVLTENDFSNRFCSHLLFECDHGCYCTYFISINVKAKSHVNLVIFLAIFLIFRLLACGVKNQDFPESTKPIKVYQIRK